MLFRSAAELEAGLDGGDVGEGEVVVGADQIVGRLEQKADTEGRFPAAVDGAEGVTDLQPEPVGERAGDGDGVGFGDEGDGIGRIFQRILKPVGDEFAVGKGIDADEMEEFARMGGQRCNDLEHGCGLADGGIGPDDGQQGFGDAEALTLDGEVGPAGHEVERGVKGTKGGFIDRLDGDDGADADGEGGDVEKREGFVGEEVATTMG